MDSTVTYLYSLLPDQWKPYVVLFLLVAYVVTKWRSNTKSVALKAHQKEFLPQINDQGFFSKVIDLIF